MRFTTTIILLFLVLSQTFSQWFVLAAFKINQAYIAKNTCENRYRPQMNCNGNCVLMRKMKQQEKEDQNSPGTPKLEFSNIILSSRSFFTAELSLSTDTYQSIFPIFNTGKPVDMPFAVFHPPQA
jgi:hypothetical protein